MTTKLIFDIILTIVIIYIFFIYNVENLEDTSETNNQIKKAINQVYMADIEAIRNLSAVASKLNSVNKLTIPGNLIVSGEIKSTNCFASGNIAIGSNVTKINAQIKQNGDIDGNNLNLNGSITNIGNITVTNGNINVSTDTYKGDQIQLINTHKKDYPEQADKWIISNMKSNNDTINNNKLSFTRMNGDIDKGVGLDLYDNGKVNIPGNLEVSYCSVNNLLSRRNKAQYIRVGNIKSIDLVERSTGVKLDSTKQISEFSLQYNWHLIEIRVFDINNDNVSHLKPVEKLSGETYFDDEGWTDNGYKNKKGEKIKYNNKDRMRSSENLITNIVNGQIFKTGENLSDNMKTGFVTGYQGRGRGGGDNAKHQIEINLGKEYDISHIELYNRYNDYHDSRTDEGNDKTNPTYGFPYTSRMNGTIVELISEIPPGKTKEDRIINHRIDTGLWHFIYSKVFIL